MASIPLANPQRVGGKAAGLLRISPDWYPPSLIVNVSGERQEIDDALNTLEQIPDYATCLETLWSSSPSSGVIVRSNAVGEDISARGSLLSISCTSKDDVRQAIRNVWSDARERRTDNELIGLIMEPFLRAPITGHLSNEMRVSRDATTWSFEIIRGSTRSQRQIRVSTTGTAREVALLCHHQTDIESVIRSVARWLSEQPYRFHLEWVWTLDRIWIVQADRVHPTIGPPPGEAWQPTRGRLIDERELEFWRPCSNFDSTEDDRLSWGKIAALRSFASAILPVPTVWLLAGDSLTESNSEHIARELGLLASGELLIRTDLRSERDQPSLMLPKTRRATTSVNELLDFARTTLAEFQHNGFRSTDVAFLAHRFIRSRASAWSRASPDGSVVEIHSIWGLADGLAWLPHDQVRFNCATGDIRRSIAGKTAFLDVSGADTWAYRETPSEWIWRSSVSEDQIRTIGLGAKRLASLAGVPIVTMWFIGVLDGAEADCLPWFQAVAPGASSNLGRGIIPQLPRFEVRTEADLDALAMHETLGRRLIGLRPSEQLVRSKDFVDRVIAIARSSSSVVEISGSTLAHPYYMLQAAGIPVVCRTTFEGPLDEPNKLVRDEIPEHIASEGEVVDSYSASPVELERRLRSKIVEEALELLAAYDVDGMVDEFADLAEATESLRRISRISRDKVRVRQASKKTYRGGFDQGNVLVSVGYATPDEETAPLPGLEAGHVERAPRVVTSEDGRVVASLIPPAHAQQRVFRITNGTMDVTIEYREKELVIYSPRGGEPGVAALDLPLTLW